MSSFKEDMAKFELECELKNSGFQTALTMVRAVADKGLEEVEESLRVPAADTESSRNRELDAYLLGQKEVWEDILNFLNSKKNSGW